MMQQKELEQSEDGFDCIASSFGKRIVVLPLSEVDLDAIASSVITS